MLKCNKKRSFSMKKICILLLVLSLITPITTACVKKQKPSMVQSQRRFAKYVEAQNKAGGTVDLSEGPRQNYDADFGPQSINFDVKIVDPYKY